MVIMWFYSLIVCLMLYESDIVPLVCHGYRCVCPVWGCKEQVREICVSCAWFLRCSCQNILKGKWVLRSSEIQCSNKISLYKQSGSNVLHQQPRKSRVRHLLLGSHHSKVEIIQWSMKASFPNLNMIGRWIPCQTLHGILSVVSRLRQVSIHVFLHKKKCESMCQ